MPLACLDRAICPEHFYTAIELHSNWVNRWDVAANYLRVVNRRKPSKKIPNGKL